MSRAAGITGRGRTELAALLGSGGRFVTPTDVASALGIDRDSAAKRLARWSEDGWVRRVRRGLYIGVPVGVANPTAWSEDPLAVAAAVWSPCFFTGWTSANHWALMDRVFRTTVLKTTGRVRSSKVRLLEHDYLIGHTTADALTWGTKSEWQNEIPLHFADAARTVIDVLDQPGLAGGIRHGAGIVAAYLEDRDPKTLVDYGDRLGNRTVFKRLGYVIEALGLDLPDILAACAERRSEGISALDPKGPKGGRRSMRWRLRVNVAPGLEEPS